MLMSVLLLVAVLSGESFATKPLVGRLKPSTEVEAAAPLKRNLYQFGRMILRSTGRNPLDFNNYGCWCGSGGKGKVVDEVDQCCNTHDKCYDKIRASKACGWPYHWAPYGKSYVVLNNYTTCAPRKVYKTKEEADCKYSLCMCDLEAAKCFRTAKYNKTNKNYPQKKC